MKQDEKECPFCFEVIKKAAIKCKNCGSILNEPEDGSKKLVYGLETDEKLRVREEALIDSEIEWQYDNQKRIEAIKNTTVKILELASTPPKSKGGCAKELMIVMIIFILLYYI